MRIILVMLHCVVCFIYAIADLWDLFLGLTNADLNWIWPKWLKSPDLLLADCWQSVYVSASGRNQPKRSIETAGMKMYSVLVPYVVRTQFLTFLAGDCVHVLAPVLTGFGFFSDDHFTAQSNNERLRNLKPNLFWHFSMHECTWEHFLQW